jgi:hypothetical protein
LWKDFTMPLPRLVQQCLRLAKQLPKPPAGRAARSVRPRCEALEERNLLTSFTPIQIRHAYGFDRVNFADASHSVVTGDGTGQTIAIVDAFNDPNIASDLAHFDSTYSIADPPSFTKVNQRGGTTMPSNDRGWSQEIALDVEYAHAMAPGADILLVEADSSSFTNLDTAVQYAAGQGAAAISMSYGSGEFSGETSVDSVFNHSGTTYMAASGDNGRPGIYPAYSQKVMAVGGTSLTLASNNDYQSESGWSGSGGGISQYESQPSYQVGVVTQTSTKRAIPDLAFVADPNTGVKVYDTYGGSGTYTIGGTSAASPIMAGLTAIVDQGRSYLLGRTSYSSLDFLNALYHLPQSDLTDITTGNNGFAAGTGYDLVTGRGTPIVDRFVSGMIGAPVASPSAGALLVTGGGRGSSDTITLSQSGSQLVVEVAAGTAVAGSDVPADQTFTFNSDQYSSVTISTGDGTTTVNVQDSTSVTVNLAAHGNTTVNVGADHNTINVWETAPGTSTTISGASTMTVTVGKGGKVQNIQGDVTLTNPTSASAIVVDDSADSTNRTVSLDTVAIGGSSYGQIVGLAAGKILYKYSDTSSILIKTGTGTETVNVLATGTLGTGTGATTVEGHSANTTVNVGGSNTLANILGTVTITNTSNYTKVNINDSSDTANHTNVTLAATSLTGLSQGAINFGSNALASLTINGGSGNNTYTIANTQNSGVPGGTVTTLNTGSGTDAVNVQGTTGKLTVNSSSGSGADIITLGNAFNALSAITAAVTVSAAASDTLVLGDQGFSSARTFTVTSTTVAWGGPTITYSGLAVLRIKGGTAGNTFNVSSTSATAALTIVGGSGNNTLAGANTADTWVLSGTNAGTLSGSAYGSNISFSQVGSLTAGSAGDTFRFADGASLGGTITGGGSDTLDYSLYSSSVVVDLQTGQATGVSGGVSGILNVLGGTGGPAGAYNLLIGSGGGTLTGGTGRRNILVAGSAAATLVAGDQEDLLIAGSTAYDTQSGLTSWLQIAAYWAGSDDYATRVSNLTSGSGVPLLDATVVTGNGGGNVNTGNGALALIFSDGLDTVSNFDGNSQTVTISP